MQKFTAQEGRAPAPGECGRKRACSPSSAPPTAPDASEQGPTRYRQVARSPCEAMRSEEHTSELQSRLHLVCRLLLEKKKRTHRTRDHSACDCCSTTDCREDHSWI